MTLASITPYAGSSVIVARPNDRISLLDGVVIRFRRKKRAVNADNFVVAAEERIVSFTYELELVPVVLIQQGLARLPMTSQLHIEPCTTRSRMAQLRKLE